MVIMGADQEGFVVFGLGLVPSSSARSRERHRYYGRGEFWRRITGVMATRIRDAKGEAGA